MRDARQLPSLKVLDNSASDLVEVAVEYADMQSATAGLLPAEYVDVGISGTKEKRPELDRLMADANRRRFDAVLVASSIS